MGLNIFHAKKAFNKDDIDAIKNKKISNETKLSENVFQKARISR